MLRAESPNRKHPTSGIRLPYPYPYPLPVARYVQSGKVKGVQFAAIQANGWENLSFIQNPMGVKVFSKHTKGRAVLAVGLVLAITACSRKDEATIDTAMAPAAGMADSGLVPTPAPVLSDANIVFILDNVNMLDSVAGSVASTKGTSADVREFGQMMMRDHHSLRQQGQAVAKKLAVAPEAPVNDDSKAALDRTMTLLNGASKGKDFDKAYIDNEVMYHKSLLETAITAMGAAQRAELQNLIQKAAPVIQAHLDRAQAIQTTQSKM